MKNHKQHYKNKCRQNIQTTIMNGNKDVYILREVEVTNIQSLLQRSIAQLSSNCYCLCIGCKQRSNKQSNCCCLHQVVNSDIYNCSNNKEF